MGIADKHISELIITSIIIYVYSPEGSKYKREKETDYNTTCKIQKENTL